MMGSNRQGMNSLRNNCPASVESDSGNIEHQQQQQQIGVTSQSIPKPTTDALSASSSPSIERHTHLSSSSVKAHPSSTGARRKAIEEITITQSKQNDRVEGNATRPLERPNDHSSKGGDHQASAARGCAVSVTNNIKRPVQKRRLGQPPPTTAIEILDSDSSTADTDSRNTKRTHKQEPSQTKIMGEQKIPPPQQDTALSRPRTRSGRKRQRQDLQGRAATPTPSEYSSGEVDLAFREDDEESLDCKPISNHVKRRRTRQRTRLDVVVAASSGEGDEHGGHDNRANQKDDEHKTSRQSRSQNSTPLTSDQESNNATTSSKSKRGAAKKRGSNASDNSDGSRKKTRRRKTQKDSNVSGDDDDANDANGDQQRREQEDKDATERRTTEESKKSAQNNKGNVSSKAESQAAPHDGGVRRSLRMRTRRQRQLAEAAAAAAATAKTTTSKKAVSQGSGGKKTEKTKASTRLPIDKDENDEPRTKESNPKGPLHKEHESKGLGIQQLQQKLQAAVPSRKNMRESLSISELSSTRWKSSEPLTININMNKTVVRHQDKSKKVTGSSHAVNQTVLPKVSDGVMNQEANVHRISNDYSCNEADGSSTVANAIEKTVPNQQQNCHAHGYLGQTMSQTSFTNPLDFLAQIAEDERRGSILSTTSHSGAETQDAAILDHASGAKQSSSNAFNSLESNAVPTGNPPVTNAKESPPIVTEINGKKEQKSMPSVPTTGMEPEQRKPVSLPSYEVVETPPTPVKVAMLEPTQRIPSPLSATLKSEETKHQKPASPAAKPMAQTPETPKVAQIEVKKTAPSLEAKPVESNKQTPISLPPGTTVKTGQPKSSEVVETSKSVETDDRKPTASSPETLQTIELDQQKPSTKLDSKSTETLAIPPLETPVSKTTQTPAPLQDAAESVENFEQQIVMQAPSKLTDRDKEDETEAVTSSLPKLQQIGENAAMLSGVSKQLEGVSSRTIKGEVKEGAPNSLGDKCEEPSSQSLRPNHASTETHKEDLMSSKAEKEENESVFQRTSSEISTRPRDEEQLSVQKLHKNSSGSSMHDGTVQKESVSDQHKSGNEESIGTSLKQMQCESSQKTMKNDGGRHDSLQNEATSPTQTIHDSCSSKQPEALTTQAANKNIVASSRHHEVGTKESQPIPTKVNSPLSPYQLHEKEETKQAGDAAPTIEDQRNNDLKIKDIKPATQKEIVPNNLGFLGKSDKVVAVQESDALESTGARDQKGNDEINHEREEGNSMEKVCVKGDSSRDDGNSGISTSATAQKERIGFNDESHKPVVPKETVPVFNSSESLMVNDCDNDKGDTKLDPDDKDGASRADLTRSEMVEDNPSPTSRPDELTGISTNMNVDEICNELTLDIAEENARETPQSHGDKTGFRLGLGTAVPNKPGANTESSKDKHRQLKDAEKCKEDNPRDLSSKSLCPVRNEVDREPSSESGSLETGKTQQKTAGKDSKSSEMSASGTASPVDGGDHPVATPAGAETKSKKPKMPYSEIELNFEELDRVEAPTRSNSWDFLDPSSGQQIDSVLSRDHDLAEKLQAAKEKSFETEKVSVVKETDRRDTAIVTTTATKGVTDDNSIGGPCVSEGPTEENTVNIKKMSPVEKEQLSTTNNKHDLNASPTAEGQFISTKEPKHIEKNVEVAGKVIKDVSRPSFETANRVIAKRESEARKEDKDMAPVPEKLSPNDKLPNVQDSIAQSTSDISSLHSGKDTQRNTDNVLEKSGSATDPLGSSDIFSATTKPSEPRKQIIRLEGHGTGESNEIQQSISPSSAPRETETSQQANPEQNMGKEGQKHDNQLEMCPPTRGTKSVTPLPDIGLTILTECRGTSDGNVGAISLSAYTENRPESKGGGGMDGSDITDLKSSPSLERETVRVEANIMNDKPDLSIPLGGEDKNRELLPISILSESDGATPPLVADDTTEESKPSDTKEEALDESKSISNEAFVSKLGGKEEEGVQRDKANSVKEVQSSPTEKHRVAGPASPKDALIFPVVDEKGEDRSSEKKLNGMTNVSLLGDLTSEFMESHETEGLIGESPTVQMTSVALPLVHHLEEMNQQTTMQEVSPEIPLEDPQRTLENIKVKLYVEASNVHRGRSVRYLFDNYWSVLSRCVGCNSRRNSFKNKLKEGREVFRKFLTTRKLKRYHNDLIMATINCTQHEQIRKAKVRRYLPLSWQSRVQDVKPTLSIREQKLSSAFEKDLRESYDGTSAVWTPYGKGGAMAIPDMTGLNLSRPLVEESDYESSPLPGALTIDPFVRKAAQQVGLKVAENALWLVIVGMREYTKKLLRNTIAGMQQVNDHQRLVDPFHLCSIKAVEKDKQRSTAVARIGSESVNAVVQAEGNKRKCITPMDISACLMSNPLFRGRSRSRICAERSLYASFTPVGSYMPQEFAAINKYIASNIHLGLLPNKRQRTEDPSFAPPAAEPSRGAHQQAPATAPSTPGTAIASSSVATMHPTINTPSSVPSVPCPLPILDPQTPSAPALPPKVVPIPSQSTTIGGSSKTEPDEVKTSFSKPSATIKNAPMPAKMEQAQPKPIRLAAGVGRGAKNLAALKSRATATTPRSEDHPQQSPQQQQQQEQIPIQARQQRQQAPSLQQQNQTPVASQPASKPSVAELKRRVAVLGSKPSVAELQKRMAGGGQTRIHQQEQSVSPHPQGAGGDPNTPVSAPNKGQTTAIPGGDNTVTNEADPASSPSKSNSPAQRARGRGFGVKNLAAMRSRNSTPTNSNAPEEG